MDDAATLELFRKTLTNLSSGPMREKLQRELVGCLIKELGGEDMKLSVEYNRHDKFVDVILDVNSFDDIVHSYLKDADDPGHNLATYVNQWIYRSTCGMTFPCERFYNSTSLNGQTLFNQWYCVVSSCEAIGRNVLGTSCDAGGGNASFFFAFRKWKKIAVEDCWISKEFIKAPHPFNPRRWIFRWHCTAHLMKSMRNALYNSKPDGSRLFHDLNDLTFGWATMQTLWASDQQFFRRKTL
jgi:hypothetical protein